MLKLVSVKFVSLLIILTVLKPVIPMLSSTASASVEGNYCLMMAVKESVVSNCHSSDVQLFEMCCDADCSSNYVPLLFTLALQLPIPNSTHFSSVYIDLYSIYLNPSIPPPILS